MTSPTDEMFSLELLQAINDWQIDSKPARANRLKAACESLPAEFKEVHLACFRQIALEKGSVWDLIGENQLPEKVSSWSVDVEIVKGFKGGVPPEGQGYQGVIFCLAPQSANVVLNLRALYRDSDFVRAHEAAQGQIAGYHLGIGKYGDSQSEVIIETAALSQDDVYSLGGHSSSFDELVDAAALEIYGRRPTAAERNDLFLKVEHVRAKAGPAWLGLEATRRVLFRLAPEAERLKMIKKFRDAR